MGRSSRRCICQRHHFQGITESGVDSPDDGYKHPFIALFFSTALTLVVVPVIYYIFADTVDVAAAKLRRLPDVRKFRK